MTAARLPTGTVTFLFTDLEGSTRLWQEHPAAMQPALSRYDEIVRRAIETHGGAVVKTTYRSRRGNDWVDLRLERALGGVTIELAEGVHRRQIMDRVDELETVLALDDSGRPPDRASEGEDG